MTSIITILKKDPNYLTKFAQPTVPGVPQLKKCYEPNSPFMFEQQVSKHQPLPNMKLMLRRCRDILLLIDQKTTNFTEASLHAYMAQGGYKTPSKIPGSLFCEESASIVTYHTLAMPPSTSSMSIHPNPKYCVDLQTKHGNLQRAYESAFLKFLFTACHEQVLYENDPKLPKPWYVYFTTCASVRGLEDQKKPKAITAAKPLRMETKEAANAVYIEGELYEPQLYGGEIYEIGDTSSERVSPARNPDARIDVGSMLRSSAPKPANDIHTIEDEVELDIEGSVEDPREEQKEGASNPIAVRKPIKQKIDRMINSDDDLDQAQMYAIIQQQRDDNLQRAVQQVDPEQLQEQLQLLQQRELMQSKSQQQDAPKKDEASSGMITPPNFTLHREKRPIGMGMRQTTVNTYFPSFPQISRYVLFAAHFLHLSTTRVFKLGAKGKMITDSVDEQLKEMPNFKADSFFIQAPKGQLACFPVHHMGSPFNRLTCSLNPALASSFYSSFDTENMLFGFVSAFFASFKDKAATFPCPHKAFEVIDNVPTQLSNRTMKTRSTNPRVYFFERPFKNSRHSLLLRAKPLTANDKHYPTILSKTAAEFFLSKFSFLANKDFRYFSKKNDKEFGMQVELGAKIIEHKVDEFLGKLDHPQTSFFYRNCAALLKPHKKEDYYDGCIKFFKELANATVVPDDVGLDQLTLVTLESVSSFDMVLHPDSIVQNFHQVFADLESSGCNGLAGLYYVFNDPHFVVPLQLSSVRHYGEYDFNYGGASNKVKTYSQVGAVAISLSQTKFTMETHPVQFDRKNPALITQQFDQAALGAVVGFGLSQSMPIIEPVFRRCERINKVVVKNQAINYSHEGCLPPQEVIDGMDFQQLFFPEFRAYQLFLIESTDLNKLAVMALCGPEIAKHERIYLSLGAKAKMHWFATFEFFFKGKIDKSDLEDTDLYQHAKNNPIQESYKHMYKLGSDQTFPAAAFSTTVILGKSTHQFVDEEVQDSDYEPTVRAETTQKRRRAE